MDRGKDCCGEAPKAASLVAGVKRAKGGFSGYHNTTDASKATAHFVLSIL